MQAKALGYEGEKLAADFLRKKGYEIVQQNFTVRGGEIDLVAKRGETLVFVEVKTRTNEQFGSGDESFTSLKKRRILRAIEQYLYRTYRDADVDYRVDLIEIALSSGKQPRIRHFEDVET